MVFFFYKRKTQILSFLPSVNFDVDEIGSIVVERGVWSGPNKRTQGTTTAVMKKKIIMPMTIHFVSFPTKISYRFKLIEKNNLK
jgi:hypothetical protein